MSKADRTDNWRSTNLDLTMAAYRAYDTTPTKPVENWRSRYRCEACHQVLSRKVMGKQPSVVEKCGHVLCLNCAKSGFHADIITCPMETCKPQKIQIQKIQITKKADELKEEKSTVENTIKPEYTCEPKELAVELEEDYNCPLCDNEFLECTCVDSYIREPAQPMHYCFSEGDCGELPCGCIDVCRCSTYRADYR